MRSDSDGDDVLDDAVYVLMNDPREAGQVPRIGWTVRVAGGDGTVEHGYEIENTGTGKWSGGERLVERRRGVQILLQNRLALAVPRQIRSPVYPD